ncbi:MAG: DUF4111 domain-containing protein [Lachnospiraceae bacterium]|jgi:streptomycin 3"-adenylyltransferase|nr:DUF4111 domain-containing protein [Lachnospiraceae bacterium]
MNQYSTLINNFVQENQNILSKNLVGVYLHGSAAMGCFNSQRSDLDFIIVIKNDLFKSTKHSYMDMVVNLNKKAPKKGIELSVVKENVCSPFVYPTPFELHFSIAHLNWYQTNPDDYIEKMHGTDKDLAAHFTVLYYRGKTLYGKAIRDVFSKVSKRDYFKSIWNDIENAQNEIIENSTYIILNLCRVLAFRRDDLILSKLEGGRWGLQNVPLKYTGLIANALAEYESNESAAPDEALAKEYAEYMLRQISSHS